MTARRKWIEPAPIEVDPEFRAAIGGHPLVAELLHRRGLDRADDAKAFLDPSLYQPTSPWELPGLGPAVERLAAALQNGEKIGIWGDFDVDGQTATTLLVSALREAGGEVAFHIPNREHESHGLNLENLRPLLESGIGLLVTCDTGISAVEEIQYAQGQGVDVIVTDHHDLPETTPAAHSLLNPKFLPPEHPLRELPGVGVAYLLVAGMYDAGMEVPPPESFHDLVALGAVADLAVVGGEVRYLIQRGLVSLRETERPGLRLLMQSAGLRNGHLTEEHIAFLLAPRLNALGRLSDARLAVELLSTDDPQIAEPLVAELEELNKQRKQLTEWVLETARERLSREPSLMEAGALVLADERWPVGVIGIVAGRLAEELRRPVILLSAPLDGLARGSARSVAGIDISEAIAAQADYLESFGGHPMAAGLAIQRDRIPAFRRGLAAYLADRYAGFELDDSLQLDGYLPLEQATLEIVRDLERLAPFGPGNPAPILWSPGHRLKDARPIGRDGEHLLLQVELPSGGHRRVVWWRAAGQALPEGTFDLAYLARSSNYRGEWEVQFQFVAVRESAPIAVPTAPGRRRLRIEDYRWRADALMREQPWTGSDDFIVWSEGPEQARVPGVGRGELEKARTLILWTAPADLSLLKRALRTVRPGSLILVCMDPGLATPADFLRHLLGMAKYAVRAEAGRMNLERAAEATAHRVATLRAGLACLARAGLIEVGELTSPVVRVSPGERQSAGLVRPDRTLQRLLTEAASFRAFLRKADPGWFEQLA